MTEQEAEVLAARLTRIWKPVEAPITVTRDRFYYRGQISRDETSVTYLVVDESQINPDMCHFVIERLWQGIGKGLGRIGYDPDENELGVYTVLDDEDKKSYAHFAVQWLPIFSRNCWLSGCDIEATAHEKMEWLQVFTREEIEALNLKF